MIGYYIMFHESSIAQLLRVLIVFSYLFYWLSYLYLSSPSYLGILSLFEYLNSYLVIISSYLRRLSLFK